MNNEEDINDYRLSAREGSDQGRMSERRKKYSKPVGVDDINL